MENMTYEEFFSKDHPLFLDIEGNLHYHLILGHCEEFSGRRGLKIFHCFKDEVEMRNYKIKDITFFNKKGQSNHPEIGTNVVYDNANKHVCHSFIAIILKGKRIVSEECYLKQCREDENDIIYGLYNI